MTLVTRIVQGPKAFTYVDEDGQTKKAHEGDEIKVSTNCAEAFPIQLVDKHVIEAQQATMAAIANARKETEDKESKLRASRREKGGTRKTKTTVTAPPSDTEE